MQDYHAHHDIFLSTPSGWRATSKAVKPPNNHRISIHALRVEGDVKRVARLYRLNGFLSTPSGWRATVSVIIIQATCRISIHALRVEGDE